MHLSISRRIIRDTAACRSRAAWYQVSLQKATKRHCAYNLFFSLVLKWFRESRSVALHVSFQARQTACMSFMKPESTNFCWRRRWKEGNVKKKKKKKKMLSVTFTDFLHETTPPTGCVSVSLHCIIQSCFIRSSDHNIHQKGDSMRQKY